MNITTTTYSICYIKTAEVGSHGHEGFISSFSQDIWNIKLWGLSHPNFTMKNANLETSTVKMSGLEDTGCGSH